MVTGITPAQKVESLTLFLIQKGFSAPEDALTAEALVASQRHELSAGLSFSGTFFLQGTHRSEPSWVPFVNSGLKTPLARLRNASTSALLFVKQDGHLFAFAFGPGGRFMLREDRVEHDFGLLVVLNAVDRAALRSVDMATFDDDRMLTRRQSSRGSSIGVFGLDPSRDMLRAVVGTPKDPAVARLVAGADRLAFRAKVSFTELGVKCGQMLALYSQNDYKTHFPWIDNLKVVRDASVVASLDEDLETRLTSGALDEMHLADPEIIEWSRVDGYRYTTDAAQVPLHNDLSLADYIAAAQQKRPNESPTVERLKSDQVHAMNEATGTPVHRWSIYRTLILDLIRPEARYALADGRWYEINKAFAAVVETQVNAIPACALDFPDAHPLEREDAYLIRAAPLMAASNPCHIALLDKQLVKTTGAETQVEVCDLFSEAGHFIHVKKGNRSSTLSHLFAQGSVSASLFVRDSQFRADVRALVANSPCDKAELFPTTSVTPGSFTVVFAIVSPRTGPAPTLPFFSQVNLMNASQTLRTMGFRVEQRPIITAAAVAPPAP